MLFLKIHGNIKPRKHLSVFDDAKCYAGKYIYFSEKHLEDYINMHKKILLYVAIMALFDILVYQSIAAPWNVYAQGPEITYGQQLGSKGSDHGQFRTPHLR
ncbi:MAG: hypothetical protein ACHQ1D_06165 [Nitrososphaerales archaeon]